MDIRMGIKFEGIYKVLKYFWHSGRLLKCTELSKIINRRRTRYNFSQSEIVYEFWPIKCQQRLEIDEKSADRRLLRGQNFGTTG